MPEESIVVRSDRFTLSISGFALVSLAVLIIFVGTSAQANDGVSVNDINHRQNIALTQALHTGKLAMEALING